MPHTNAQPRALLLRGHVDDLGQLNKELSAQASALEQQATDAVGAMPVTACRGGRIASELMHTAIAFPTTTTCTTHPFLP